MLRPSYSDLLHVLNSTVNDAAITSRYSIVISVAKRARQIVDEMKAENCETKDIKPVSMAVDELYKGKIRIKKSNEEI